MTMDVDLFYQVMHGDGAFIACFKWVDISFVFGVYGFGLSTDRALGAR